MADTTEVLRGLLEIITDKEPVLREMQREALSEHERARLGGKREGLDLARSYIEEALRGQ